MLWSTLLVQARGFVERNHERRMTSLVAALDGEKWVQCDASLSRAQGSIDLHKGVYCSVTSPLISFKSRPSDAGSRPRRRTSWRARKTPTGCTRGIGCDVNDTSRGRCSASPVRCLATAAHRLPPTQGGVSVEKRSAPSHHRPCTARVSCWKRHSLSPRTMTP